MTYREFFEKVKEVCAKHAETEKHTYIGVRFENKVRAIGEICENSRHNSDRDDERDFPEYGTDEYNSADELRGTSSWLMFDNYNDRPEDIDPMENWGISVDARHVDREIYYGCAHCYIVAGDEENTHSDADDGEIVIVGAEVIDIIY